jgi:hypothetical protein
VPLYIGPHAAKARERAAEMLERVGLGERIDHRPQSALRWGATACRHRTGSSHRANHFACRRADGQPRQRHRGAHPRLDNRPAT